MGIYKNKIIENQTIDLSTGEAHKDGVPFNPFGIADNCHFRNCEIIMADQDKGQECVLSNVIFEDCLIKPAKIHFSWFNQNSPVIFKNTKVDLVGNVIKFFWNQKIPYGERANSLDDWQRDYLNKCFSGCTINGKEISATLNEYEHISSNGLGDFVERKLSETPRNR